MSDEEQAQPNQPDDQEWLTPTQVMEIYEVSRSTVQRWYTEKKVISRKVDQAIYSSKSSVDAHLVRLKEERKARDLAAAEKRRAMLAPTVEAPMLDQGEVARLKKQVQELSYENGRLNGEVGVYEKQLEKMHTLIKELALQPR